MGDPPPLMVKVYLLHAGWEYTKIKYFPKMELSGSKGGLILVLKNKTSHEHTTTITKTS